MIRKRKVKCYRWKAYRETRNKTKRD